MIPNSILEEINIKVSDIKDQDKTDKFYSKLALLQKFVNCNQFKDIRKFINKKIKQLYNEVQDKVAKLVFDSISLDVWSTIYNKVIIN